MISEILRDLPGDGCATVNGRIMTLSVGYCGFCTSNPISEMLEMEVLRGGESARPK
jgi:hypothetical protein